jgi:hypothetical protein
MVVLNQHFASIVMEDYVLQKIVDGPEILDQVYSIIKLCRLPVGFLRLRHLIPPAFRAKSESLAVVTVKSTGEEHVANV